MFETVTIDTLRDRIDNLQSSIAEEITEGFDSVISSDEGKLLLVQIYAARLAPMLVKVQRSLDMDLDLDSLQAYLNDLELFIYELRSAIQFPHRIKIENDLAHWLLNWFPNERVDWNAFLVESAETDLVEIDVVITDLIEIQISDKELRGILSKWIALQIIDLSKFEKTVPSLLKWLELVKENLNESLQIEKELASIENKINVPDWNSIHFLSSAWLRDMRKQLFGSDPIRDWSAKTTKGNLAAEWGDVRNRLTNIRPLLSSINEKELEIVKHDIKYSIKHHNLDDLIEGLRKLAIHKPDLNKPQLQDNGRKLTIPGYKRISDFLEIIPTKKITNEKQMAFSELVSQYEKAASEIHDWIDKFSQAKGFLVRMAQNWKIIREEQISPVSDKDIERTINLCKNIQSLGDLIEAHNALLLVEKRIKQELKGTLSPRESNLFDQLTHKAAADDKLINPSCYLG